MGVTLVIGVLVWTVVAPALIVLLRTRLTRPPIGAVEPTGAPSVVRCAGRAHAPRAGATTAQRTPPTRA